MFVSESGNLYRGLSIDASYQNSGNWLSSFKEQVFLEIAYQKQELPVTAMFVSELGQHARSIKCRSYWPSRLILYTDILPLAIARCKIFGLKGQPVVK